MRSWISCRYWQHSHFQNQITRSKPSVCSNWYQATARVRKQITELKPTVDWDSYHLATADVLSQITVWNQLCVQIRARRLYMFWVRSRDWNQQCVQIRARRLHMLSEIDHKTETNCVRFEPDNASTPRNIFLAIGSVTKQSRPITCCCEVATNDQACSTERKPAIFNVIEVWSHLWQLQVPRKLCRQSIRSIRQILNKLYPDPQKNKTHIRHSIKKRATAHSFKRITLLKKKNWYTRPVW